MKFQTIRSFGHSIFSGKIALSGVDKKQSNVLENILEFNCKTRPKSKADEKKKLILLKV